MNSAPAAASSPSFLAHARAKLSLAPESSARMRGDDHVVNQHESEFASALADAKPAAVLVGLIERPEGTTVLLTERATHLRSHSGQVAFPGGKIDPDDNGPIAAALREAEEEIGLARAHVEPFGLLDPYLSGSGYCIVPVVAEIHAPFDLVVNHHEVAGVFETPFAFVMNPANHQRQSREWKGVIRHFYAMPWENKYIWGVTAGILRNLYERLYV